MDAYFLRTPYREDGGLQASDTHCAPARLDPALLMEAPDEASQVLLALQWPRSQRAVPARQIDLVWSYPASEGAHLIEQIHQSGKRLRSLQEFRVVRIDHCARFLTQTHTYVEVCRQGVAP
jgi:hypothetical protein